MKRFLKAQPEPGQSLPQGSHAHLNAMLGLQPLAQLFQRLIVDGLYVRASTSSSPFSFNGTWLCWTSGVSFPRRRRRERALATYELLTLKRVATSAMEPRALSMRFRKFCPACHDRISCGYEAYSILP
nr:hypothetical protein [Noviherbaspirillum saxi]